MSRGAPQNQEQVAWTPEAAAECQAALHVLFDKMGLGCSIDTQLTDDGQLSFACFTSESVAEFAPGKRGFYVDSLQFILNRIANKGLTGRRWANVGIGGFPEKRSVSAEAPKAERPERVERQERPLPSAPVQLERAQPARQRQPEVAIPHDNAPSPAQGVGAGRPNWRGHGMALAKRAAQLNRQLKVLFAYERDAALFENEARQADVSTKRSTRDGHVVVTITPRGFAAESGRRGPVEVDLEYNRYLVHER